MRTTWATPIPESGVATGPAALLAEARNVVPTGDGILRGLGGVAPSIPDYGSGYPSVGTVWGVYHSSTLWGGTQNTTLIRADGGLYIQEGWSLTWGVLHTGLTSGPGRYKDYFVELQGKVVWTNGVDRALVYDGGRVLPLGYDRAPAAPHTRGPDQAPPGVEADKNPAIYRNASGYAHPGNIASVGDSLNGQRGSILSASYRYWVQWEDANGNLSPMSQPSSPITVRSEATASDIFQNFNSWTTLVSLAQYAVHLDDLGKQFGVYISDAPPGTQATWIYRSVDEMNGETGPRFLSRLEGRSAAWCPDNTADANLGAVPRAPLAVPVFRIMVVHAGRLVIANTSSEPGAVYMGDPGKVGTFYEKIYPDQSGSEVVGLESIWGSLFSATSSRVYEVTPTETGWVSTPVASVGVTPGTFTATPVGLMWLHKQDVVLWKKDGQPEVLTAGVTSRRDIVEYQDRAVACWDPTNAMWLCAVTEAGSTRNKLLLAYTSSGLYRYKFDMVINNLCITQDFRGYVLVAGAVGVTRGVFVLDTAGVFSHDAKVFLSSLWMSIVPDGSMQFNVTSLHFGFEECTSENLTLRLYKNGEYSEPITLELPVREDGITLAEHVSSVTKMKGPRLVWRKADVGLFGVTSFKFELEAPDSLVDFRLSAIRLYWSSQDYTGARVT